MEFNCVSISLGSSTRDKFISFNIGDNVINICRMGFDGDLVIAKKMIEKLQDEEVDSIGLGGIDLLLFINNNYFVIKDAKILYDQSYRIPVVDGSITKRILEPVIVENLIKDGILKRDQKVLLVSSLDRFQTLLTFLNSGFNVLIGDLVFALKVDKILNNPKEIEEIAKILLSDVLNLPFNLIYPIGKEQEKDDEAILNIIKKYDFDIVFGDFHYIRKIQKLLKNKIVITNTLTDKNIEELKKIEVKLLISTGIYVEGRSFGANVTDSIFAAYCLKLKNKKISPFEPLDRQIYLEFVNDFLRIGELKGKVIIDIEKY